MPSSRLFFYLLLGQIAVIFAVAGIFKMIESRFQAGMTAGAVFITLGLVIFWRGIRSREFRRTPTFFAGCAHLFGMALPMVATRLLHSGDEFQNVLVLGMPGPVFHRVSTSIFLLMMTATVFDALRSWRNERRIQVRVRS